MANCNNAIQTLWNLKRPFVKSGLVIYLDKSQIWTELDPIWDEWNFENTWVGSAKVNKPEVGYITKILRCSGSFLMESLILLSIGYCDQNNQGQHHSYDSE